MHEDDVGARERAIEVGLAGTVAARAQRGEARREGHDGGLALIDEQVPAAPAVLRLVDVDGVAGRLQLSDDAAQEGGGAVTPVGHERMTEDDELHPCTSVAASMEGGAGAGTSAAA